jgi:hypothetical protein
VKIYRLLIPCALVALLSACASTPDTSAENSDAAKPRAKCADEPQTGTMLKRCSPSETKTISREDIDRGAVEPSVRIPTGMTGK